MANPKHVEMLLYGTNAWNTWKGENPNTHVDMSEATLSLTKLNGVDLSGANLSRASLIMADLSGANLLGANLFRANLRGTDLRHVSLNRAYLSEANLDGAMLHHANLFQANLFQASLIEANLNPTRLTGANLSNTIFSNANLNGSDMSETNLNGADLSGVNLIRASLVKTNFERANLSYCRIFGISAWGLNVDNAIQSNLLVTDENEPEIAVDNLEVAQFVYLLLHNERIRDVINTIGQKSVLILGRFALPERKAILDAMRVVLRDKGFLPIVFDFEKSEERDFTETIKVLAGMSLFVIADITNPKSSPLELQATIPDYMIPFAPIIQAGERPFAMFVDLQHKYRGVLDVREYNDKDHLMSNFENGIIKPALAKHNELLVLKNEALKIRPMDEY